MLGIISYDTGPLCTAENTTENTQYTVDLVEQSASITEFNNDELTWALIKILVAVCVLNDDFAVLINKLYVSFWNGEMLLQINPIN